MKFIDHSLIRIRSGCGGAGMVSFRSAKNAPKLGADGGDGGFGGSVYLVGDAQLNTLSGLYYKQLYKAEDGAKGGTNGRTGRNGEDKRIHVPLGTVAFHAETGEQLAEVLTDKEEYLLLAGGKRGLGNLRYLSSRHQAPEESTSGGEALECELRLELKVLADVGLAGFPNAGKSTLLSVMSAARPKVADYPFTTLEPNLGVIDMQGLTGNWGDSFVMADIPGLVEGASEGRGLGHEFLRHLERTKVICYVIDPYCFEERQALESFFTLEKELRSFGRKIEKKPFLIVLTKDDLNTDPQIIEEIEAQFVDLGHQTYRISSASRRGLDELKLRLFEIIQSAEPELEVEELAKAPSIPEKYMLMSEMTDQDLLGEL